MTLRRLAAGLVVIAIGTAAPTSDCHEAFRLERSGAAELAYTANPQIIYAIDRTYRDRSAPTFKI